MKVFISCTSSDKAIADALSIELHKRDISTFLESEISPGESIQRGTKSYLDTSDAIIAILSKHSFSSHWVRYEIEEAILNEKFKGKFFPVLISNNKSDLAKLPWVLQKIRHLRLAPNNSPQVIGKRIANEFFSFINKGG